MNGKRTGVKVVAALGLALAAMSARAADQASQPAPAPLPTPLPPVTVAAEPEGFVVQSADGNYRLQFNSIVQADGRFYENDTARLASDTFLLRSARPILQGTVAGRFDLYLAPDFGQGQSLIQDAYLEARFSPFARLRVGKFKTPFGLERLMLESNTLFVERALPTDIVPNRDVGVQLAGDLAGGVFSYSAALLNGVLDGASADLATSDARDAAVRGFLRPFRKTQGPLRGLGLGMATTFGRQQGALPVYKTPGQVTFFSYVTGATADGHRTRLSPQANFYAGPVGVIFEYAQSTQRVRKDPVAADVTNQAWQVAGSWLITGDKASSSWVSPRRPFDPAKGQWGAFELAARVHEFTVGQEAFDLGLADIKKSARKATAWGVDLNWYVTRNVRYTVNFEQTKFEGGAATGNRETETMLFFRAQLAF
ncbi:MAG TPA: porin [Vicinamibacteria bacterium]|nr:porin [Vicinamibacteria bacterium]